MAPHAWAGWIEVIRRALARTRERRHQLTQTGADRRKPRLFNVPHLKHDVGSRPLISHRVHAADLRSHLVQIGHDGREVRGSSVVLVGANDLGRRVSPKRRHAARSEAPWIRPTPTQCACC